MSETLFVSPLARFVALDSNTTNRPPPAVYVAPLLSLPWTPALFTLARVLVAARAGAASRVTSASAPATASHRPRRPRCRPCMSIMSILSPYSILSACIRSSLIPSFALARGGDGIGRGGVLRRDSRLGTLPRGPGPAGPAPERGGKLPVRDPEQPQAVHPYHQPHQDQQREYHPDGVRGRFRDVPGGGPAVGIERHPELPRQRGHVDHGHDRDPPQGHPPNYPEPPGLERGPPRPRQSRPDDALRAAGPDDDRRAAHVHERRDGRAQPVRGPDVEAVEVLHGLGGGEHRERRQAGVLDQLETPGRVRTGQRAPGAHGCAPAMDDAGPGQLG